MSWQDAATRAVPRSLPDWQVSSGQYSSADTPPAWLLLQRVAMSPEAESLLIPLLSPDEAVGDPVALATWYEALSGALSVELNHDLLALWLYPAGGGVHLIGPEALAQDNIDVPLPEPYVPQDQLFRLEEKVRAAGYGSVMAVPIRFGYQDVGLLLLADLRHARYTANEAVLLQRVAHHLGPTFGRIARQWTGGVPVDEPEYHAALADGAAPLLASGGPPRDFVHAMFDLLMPLVPHDRGEILIPGSAADQWYRLGEHTSGALWSDPALIIPNEDLNLDAMFGESDSLLVGDTRRDPRWGGWPGGLRDFRSAAGVRLRAAGRRVGFLLVGGSGPDLFREQDIAVLQEAAALIGPRVENYVLSWHLQVVRNHLGTIRNVPVHLSRIAELLATAQDPGEGTRRFATEASTLLPFDLMRFALKLRDAATAVIVDPGETRPVSELPLVPVAGTALAQVIDGELPSALLARQHEAELIVPLRVAGEVIGALSLTTHGAAAYARTDLPHAQQLADVIAPHLELHRRIALATRPRGPSTPAVGRPAVPPLRRAPASGTH